MSGIIIESRMYRLKGLTPILGSLPANKSVLTDFVAAKAPSLDFAEEEADLSIDKSEKSLTVFARNKASQLCIMGYQVKGFFKSALSALRGQINITAHKSKVDLLLFIEPRYIPLKREGQPILFEDSINERPLRADGPKGPKIALAASEQVDDPWSIDIEISLLPSKSGVKSEALTWSSVEAALEYGMYHGLGQWRNADFGRFLYQRVED